MSVKKLPKKAAEAKRLEALWAGDFGDAYNERNKKAHEGRGVFWLKTLKRLKPSSVLEVGCNVGGNLRWISQALEARHVWGIDINEKALQKVRQDLPGVNVAWSPARELPFRDGQFGLVFTAGVLIHQPEESLKEVMSEVVRCSRSHILCLEYFSGDTVEVPYRGNSGALFKRDYGKIYAQSFPFLSLAGTGRLEKAEGWDDVTYWIFEKKGQKGAGQKSR